MPELPLDLVHGDGSPDDVWIFVEISRARKHERSDRNLRETVEEAVRAYTYGSAYASFDEKAKGTLAPGYLADFAVLSRDIFAIDPAEIANTRVEMTVVGGRIVYER